MRQRDHRQDQGEADLAAIVIRIHGDLRRERGVRRRRDGARRRRLILVLTTLLIAIALAGAIGVHAFR